MALPIRTHAHPAAHSSSAIAVGKAATSAANRPPFLPEGISVNAHYCPICFAETPVGSGICPVCSRDIDAWERGMPYTERLIHALKNPHPEVRMGAIISLHNRRALEATVALAVCALAYPVDVVQALAVVRALEALPNGPEKTAAFARLASHPAHAIRMAAKAVSLTDTKP